MRVPLFRFLRSTLLGLQALLALGCSKAPRPLQPIPGSSVSLAPPSGFSPAPNFSGFVSEDGRASILVTELPAQASESVRTLFVDEATARRHFATQGVQVKQLESLTADGRSIPVVVGAQHAHGHTFDKWVGLYSGAPTVLITIQVPVEDALPDRVAKDVLASVKVSPPPSLEQKLSALPFTVVAQPPFRIVDALAGSSIVMTAGELDVDPESRQPLIVIASQLSLPFSSDDLSDVSDQLIAGSHRIKDGVIDSRDEIMFAGIEGLRVNGRLSNGSTYYHYLALWPGDRFVRLVAILPPGSSVQAEKAIEEVADSVGFRL